MNTSIFTEVQNEIKNSLEEIAVDGVSFKDGAFECNVIPSRVDGFTGKATLDKTIPPAYPPFQGETGIAKTVMDDTKTHGTKWGPFILSLIEHALLYDGVKNMTDFMRVRLGCDEDSDKFTLQWWFHGDRPEDLEG